MSDYPLWLRVLNSVTAPLLGIRWSRHKKPVLAMPGFYMPPDMEQYIKHLSEAGHEKIAARVFNREYTKWEKKYGGYYLIRWRKRGKNE